MENSLIESNSHEKALIFTICAEIDLYNAPDIKSYLREKIENTEHKNIIFDFRNAKYIDSSGIGVLAILVQKFRESKHIRMCGITGSIEKVFAFARLDSFFTIDKNLEASLQALET